MYLHPPRSVLSETRKRKSEGRAKQMTPNWHIFKPNYGNQTNCGVGNCFCFRHDDVKELDIEDRCFSCIQRVEGGCLDGDDDEDDDDDRARGVGRCCWGGLCASVKMIALVRKSKKNQTNVDFDLNEPLWHQQERYGATVGPIRFILVPPSLLCSAEYRKTL